MYLVNNVLENQIRAVPLLQFSLIRFILQQSFSYEERCFDAAFGFQMKFWKYNFNMSADCRNFLEMVLTNAVMEGETERHANAGEEFQNQYCFWSQRKSIAVSMTLYTERVPMISPRRLTLVSQYMKDEGYVSDDSVGEDGSEQGDVVNGLFAEYEN